MLTHPSTCRTPHAPGGAINCTGSPPDISVMVCCPAPCTVHTCCRFFTCNRKFSCHLDKRFVQFAKSSFFCRPVIHLGIDVDCVFAIPWRIDLVIPDALKIGRLPAWL